MRVASVLLLALSVSAQQPAPTPAATAPAPAELTINIHKLEEGAWVVSESRPWPANALLVEMGPDSLVLVDTLYTPDGMRKLLSWIRRNLKGRSLLAINTHFHVDRTGGNQALLDAKVPVYASDLTVKLMKERGRAVQERVARAIKDDKERADFLAITPAPADSTFALASGLELTLGGQKLRVVSPGAAHSPDNVVVWFPDRQILFGGCMILSAPRVGNMSDADLPSWLKALDALKAFPAKRVIAGHAGGFEPAMIEETRRTVEAKLAERKP